jgi:mannose-6-phosphate isomerase
MNYTEDRPWGKFENLLEAEYCKVKRITVNPGQRLSYQYHYKRSEVWTVVQGTPVVTLDDKKINLTSGQVIEIPVGSKHRIENNTEHPVVFIEVQHGSYFGEDDIVRLEDDYNRTEDEWQGEDDDNTFYSIDNTKES